MLSASRRVPVWRDPSTFLLLFSNVLTIWFTLREGWGIGTVLLIYWGQGAAIGFFHYLKIQGVQNFIHQQQHLDETVISGVAIPSFVGMFFALHYSFFSALFLLFILVFYRPDWQAALPVIILFYFNHGFSYLFNRTQDIPHLAFSLVQLLFFPYLRILPMHVIIAGSAIFADAGPLSVIVFLLLKTLADLIMHIIEHVMARSSIPELGSRQSV